MTKYLLLLLLCTNCFASNNWICADQVKEVGWTAFCQLSKISVTNGWIVQVQSSTGHKYFFVPDPDHRWK